MLVYGKSRERRRQVQRALVGGGLRVLLASSMAEGAKCLAGGAVELIVVSDDASVAEAEALRAGGSLRSHAGATGDRHSIRLLRLTDTNESNDVLAPVRAALAG